MKIFGYELRRSDQGHAEQRHVSIENPNVTITQENFHLLFGGDINPEPITVERAMQVPAVFAAVNFLSRTMAALPLHAWRNTDDGPQRIRGGIETIIHDAPNAEWTSFGLRAYFWRQLFQRGRGLMWIERGANGQPIGLHPMNVRRTTVAMEYGRRIYSLDGIRYSASEIIDLPFALTDDQCGVMCPIAMCSGAIGLALDMQKFGRKFFAGGGVPPLALVGPMPAGPEAMKRAMADINRAVENAQQTEKPIFPTPPGYELKTVGTDPDKGQMTDGRRFQLEEIARAFQLPPVFLQDLSKGTFSNTEQQDLFFVKHLVTQWAQALEEEMNLKLFGQMNGRRYVEHNLDGLMRGDFKSRIEALARGVQTALITPDEARALENRPAMPGGDRLYIQGATIPLEKAGEVQVQTPPPADDTLGGQNDAQD